MGREMCDDAEARPRGKEALERETFVVLLGRDVARAGPAAAPAWVRANAWGGTGRRPRAREGVGRETRGQREGPR